MSGLVGNPERRFSHDGSYIPGNKLLLRIGSFTACFARTKPTCKRITETFPYKIDPSIATMYSRIHGSTSCELLNHVLSSCIVFF